MRIRRFAGSKRGATSIEYAVIASLISLLIIGGATVIGTKMSHKYAIVAGNLS